MGDEIWVIGKFVEEMGDGIDTYVFLGVDCDAIRTMSSGMALGEIVSHVAIGALVLYMCL